MKKFNFFKFKADSSNRRLKNIVDTCLLDYGKYMEKDTFSQEDIENLWRRFKTFCMDLNRVDKNMTLDSIIAPGTVIMNEFLKEVDMKPNQISSNKIRLILIELLDRISRAEDLYTEATVAIYVIGAICKIYLDTNDLSKSDVANINFREEEEKYENK